MRAAVTLLVLLFSPGGAHTRNTQSKVQTESQRTGEATAVAADLVSTQQDVSTEINELQKDVFDLKTQIVELTTILNYTQMHLDILKAAYANLNDASSVQQQEITSLKTRLDTSEAEVGNLKGKNTELKADINTIRTEMVHLAEKNTAQDAELTRLQNRLADSESEVENVKGENAAIKADMNIMRTELTTQTELNAAQESQLEAVKSRLAACEADTEDLKRENRHQNDELAEVKAGLVATNAEVQAIKAGTTATPKVAFSAGLLDYTGYVEAGDYRRSLIFRKITTNVGGAYSDITGVFRAPVRGVYYFRFTVKDYLAARYMDISMWKNAQQVLWLDDYDTDGYAAYLSTGATLQLEAGDAINLRIRAGSRIYDSHGEHSTFSGFLLFTL